MADAIAHAPVALFFQQVMQARLDALLPPGSRELRVGTGEAVSARGGGFDGAYVSVHEDLDLAAVGAAVAGAIRPGAPVVIRLPGPWPLPAVIQRTLTGIGERRDRGHTPSEARAELGPAFEWTDSYALGVLVPGSGHDRWAADHPQAFGLLAALERAVRRWPGLRQLGDQNVLEGRRRERA
jgi:hypothetical protein